MYELQKTMFETKMHNIADRIVSIFQPHVRPIVRRKSSHNVEFGSKINVSLVNGFAFSEKLSWVAFNEGKELIECIRKFGCLPKRVLADQIYCNRENRRMLKEFGVTLVAKALGRPSKEATQNRVSHGERNPIEGKFGEAKTRYGLGLINAKLKNISESWIAFTILVLKLVNLTRRVCLYIYLFNKVKIYNAC